MRPNGARGSFRLLRSAGSPIRAAAGNPGISDAVPLRCLPACVICLRSAGSLIRAEAGNPGISDAAPLLRLSACVLCLLALLLLPLAAFAGYPMHVRDARGKMITVKAKPMRIVSIAPGNTELLYALGLDDRIVGVTKYCNYPPRAKTKPKIGDMQTSAEAVVAQKPDLVVAHAFVNSGAIGQLEGLGLTVFAIDPKTIPDVMRDIRTIGRITARPRTAESIVAKMRKTLDAVKASRAGKKSRSVLFVVQPSPIWTAGPKTFVDEIIKLTNASNVAYDARSGFVTFSRELAISRNPDVIVVGVKSDVSYFLKSPEWRNTNAVRNKRIVVILSDLMTRPGPRLADGAKALAKAVTF